MRLQLQIFTVQIWYYCCFSFALNKMLKWTKQPASYMQCDICFYTVQLCFYNYTVLGVGLVCGVWDRGSKCVCHAKSVRVGNPAHNKDHNCHDTDSFTLLLFLHLPLSQGPCPGVPSLPPSCRCPCWATHAWIQCAPLCSLKASITVHTQSAQNTDMFLPPFRSLSPSLSFIFFPSLPFFIPSSIFLKKELWKLVELQ